MEKNDKKDLNVKDDSKTYYAEGMSLGICFVVALGIIIGVLVDNIGICICFGISIGMCLGMGIGSLIKKDDSNDK